MRDRLRIITLKIDRRKSAWANGIAAILGALVYFGPRQNFTGNYFPNLFASVLELTFFAAIVGWGEVQKRSSRRLLYGRTEHGIAHRSTAPRAR